MFVRVHLHPLDPAACFTILLSWLHNLALSVILWQYKLRCQLRSLRRGFSGRGSLGSSSLYILLCISQLQWRQRGESKMSRVIHGSNSSNSSNSVNSFMSLVGLTRSMNFLLKWQVLLCSLDVHYRMKIGNGCLGEEWQEPEKDLGDSLTQHVGSPYPHLLFPCGVQLLRHLSYGGFRRHPCFHSNLVVLDQLYGIFASMNPIWELGELWMMGRHMHAESSRQRPKAILHED